jgi:hypothetical protein
VGEKARKAASVWLRLVQSPAHMTVGCRISTIDQVVNFYGKQENSAGFDKGADLRP